jgi:hypothetical protein
LLDAVGHWARLKLVLQGAVLILVKAAHRFVPSMFFWVVLGRILACACSVDEGMVPGLLQGRRGTRGMSLSSLRSGNPHVIDVRRPDILHRDGARSFSQGRSAAKN